MSRNATPSAVPSSRFTCVSLMRPKRSFCTTGATPRRAQQRRSSSCVQTPADSSGTSAPKLGNTRPKPVVLRGDLHAARAQVHDGMVAAAVAELELLDIRARRLGDHLVPQADAEHGHLPRQSLHLGVRALDGLGVARAVRQEHAVGSHGQHLGRPGCPTARRSRRSRRATKVFEDGALRSAVVGDHFEARLGRRGERERLRSRQVVGREAARTRARHRGGQVLPDDGCARAHFRREGWPRRRRRWTARPVVRRSRAHGARARGRPPLPRPPRRGRAGSRAGPARCASSTASRTGRARRGRAGRARPPARRPRSRRSFRSGDTSSSRSDPRTTGR